MRRVVMLLAAGLVLAGCQTDTPPAVGHVAGLVGGWPARPQGGDIAPAQDMTVEFHPADGSAAQSTRSDADGRYDIALRPGVYEVRLAGFEALRLLYARNPKTYGQWPRVTVVAAQTARLDLIYDTMIR